MDQPIKPVEGLRKAIFITCMGAKPSDPVEEQVARCVDIGALDLAYNILVWFMNGGGATMLPMPVTELPVESMCVLRAEQLKYLGLDVERALAEYGLPRPDTLHEVRTRQVSYDASSTVTSQQSVRVDIDTVSVLMMRGSLTGTVYIYVVVTRDIHEGRMVFPAQGRLYDMLAKYYEPCVAATALELARSTHIYSERKVTHSRGDVVTVSSSETVYGEIEGEAHGEEK